MHNKTSEPVEDDYGNRSIRKSKSTSNLSVNLFPKYSYTTNQSSFFFQVISKKKTNNTLSVKIEPDVDNNLEVYSLPSNQIFE